MSALGPAVLAFVVACAIAVLEVITSRYPRTYFVLTPTRSWALYAHAAIYGLIAFGVTLGLSALTDSGVVRLEGLGLGDPWVQSLAAGLTVKAFLHIRLFSATVGSQSFPIGVESLVQLFEPWLLASIATDEFNGVREFLEPRAQRYPDLNDVRQRIHDNLPRLLTEQERAAFLRDVEAASRTTDAMELYLGLLGKRTFDRVFPS